MSLTIIRFLFGNRPILTCLYIYIYIYICRFSIVTEWHLLCKQRSFAVLQCLYAVRSQQTGCWLSSCSSRWVRQSRLHCIWITKPSRLVHCVDSGRRVGIDYWLTRQVSRLIMFNNYDSFSTQSDIYRVFYLAFGFIFILYFSFYNLVLIYLTFRTLNCAI